jgi:hypothetical protein
MFQPALFPRNGLPDAGLLSYLGTVHVDPFMQPVTARLFDIFVRGLFSY